MSHEPTIPETGRCLTCGYFLRGLPTPVCPECGRAFDPADASTYDLRPSDWRRRWWIKRGAVGVIVAVILVVAGPRALLKGRIEFKCAVCGETTTAYRWEPKPPRWIASRLFGLHWTARASASQAGGLLPCGVHSYNVSVRFDMHNGGSAVAKGTSGPGDTLTLNGMETTVETAPEVLKHLMDPLNNGIGP